MPELPRYSSQRQLTTQQPSPLAPKDTEGQVLAKVAETAGAVKDTVFNWNKEVNNMRANQTLYNMRLKIQDVNERWAVDPDPNNKEKYKKEIDDAHKEMNQGFSDPWVGAEVSSKLGYEAVSAKVQIEGLGKKKLIAQQRASSQDQITQIVNTPSGDLAADLDRVKNFYEADRFEGLENMNPKIFGPEELQKLKVEADKDMRMNTFLKEFRDNPREAEKKFESGAYGFTIETAEKARSKMKEIMRMDREAQTENVANASLAILSGDMTEKAIDQMMEANQIDASQGVTEKQGASLKAALYRDIKTRIGAKEYEKQKKAIDFIFSDSQQDKITVYEAVLNAYKDGVTPEESGFLHKIAAMKKDVIFAQKAAAGKKFLETLFGARAKDIKEETQNMLRYAQRISNGMSPEDASRATALDVVQKDHPATVGDPDLAGTFSPSQGFKPVPKVKKDESSTGKGR